MKNKAQKNSLKNYGAQWLSAVLPFIIIEFRHEGTFLFVPIISVNFVHFSAVFEPRSRTVMRVTWLVTCPRFSVDLVQRGFMQMELELSSQISSTARQRCPLCHSEQP
jgi:hypothetical protein